MQFNSISNEQTIFQKFMNFDFILLFCILLLGIIGLLQCILLMEVSFYFIAKVIYQIFNFFSNDDYLSFFNIRFWHYTAYVFYVIVLILLIWASLYGVKASGSQRWVDLYFINLQPSELMKVAIIVCLARYYHRVQIDKVNSFQNLLTAIVILILPMMLVISQPDLGTSILIASKWIGCYMAYRLKH